MKFVAIAAFLLLLVPASAMAEPKILTFPEAKPQFSVAIDDSWAPTITSDGILSAHPDAPFAISVFPVGATTAPGAVEETLAAVRGRFTDVQLGKLDSFTSKNRVKFLERHVTAMDKDSPREALIAAFTIDGKAYYALFQAGTPKGTKTYSGDVTAILKSIAPLASNARKAGAERGR